MNVLSVCSGIGAPEAAWSPLGWNFIACSEIDAFPSAVMAHHYPDVPNWGDMTKWKDWPDADIDVLVGGTPCQSFSVQGLRKGLDDPRGNLALTYLAIAARYRPRWLVWENVPGVLSSNGGRDFGAFLGAMGQLGYGWAYRSLDAQYFGLAQRRRRVFVVGCLGDWRRAAAVLFEPESLSGHPAPRRKAGEGIVGTLTSRASGGGGGPGAGTDEAAAGYLQVAFTIKDYGADAGEIAPTLRAMGHAASHANGGGQVAVAQCADTLTARWARSNGAKAGNSVGMINAITYPNAVRRLTPTECERLQGFPDHYTAIIYRGKSAADGPRYKALGNSMAVPVVRWIGERIEAAAKIEAEGAGRSEIYIVGGQKLLGGLSKARFGGIPWITKRIHTGC